MKRTFFLIITLLGISLCLFSKELNVGSYNIRLLTKADYEFIAFAKEHPALTFFAISSVSKTLMHLEHRKSHILNCKIYCKGSPITTMWVLEETMAQKKANIALCFLIKNVSRS